MYEPANCVWATAAQQSRNRRSSKLTAEQVESIRHGEFKGMSAGAVSAIVGVTRGHVNRVRSGREWSADPATRGEVTRG